ncbi:SHOCT domain-containing protein [Georgenia muralis]
MMWDGWGMGGSMGWGWLFWLLLVVGIVLLVVLVVRLLGGGVDRGGDRALPPPGTAGPSGEPWQPGEPGRPGHQGSSWPSGPGASRAREILAERYARGEIDTAEYEERLQRLQD